MTSGLQEAPKIVQNSNKFATNVTLTGNRVFIPNVHILDHLLAIFFDFLANLRILDHLHAIFFDFLANVHMGVSILLGTSMDPPNPRCPRPDWSEK